MNANNTAGAYWAGFRTGETEDPTSAEAAYAAAYWAEVGLGAAYERGVADGVAASYAAALDAEVAAAEAHEDEAAWLG